MITVSGRFSELAQGEAHNAGWRFYDGPVAEQTFSDWLHGRMRDKRIQSLSELARRLRVSPSLVGKWSRGEGYPRAKSIQKLAVFFGDPPEEIGRIAGVIPGELPLSTRTLEDLLDMARMKAPVVVPVRGILSAGPGAFQDELYLPRRYRGRELVGFYVTGDCLESDVMAGSYVAVDPDARLDQGCIVACQVDGDQFVCKKFYGDELRDNQGNAIPLSEGRIIGRVIQIVREP